MEIMKWIMAIFATVLPLAVCTLLTWRLMRNKATEWKLATCVSGLAVVTSLVLLLASEKVQFLRYGEAVLQINDKAEQIKKLTDQNKQIAMMTVRAILAGGHALMSESYDAAKHTQALEDLLKAAGAPNKEIDAILGRTNSATKAP